MPSTRGNRSSQANDRIVAGRVPTVTSYGEATFGLGAEGDTGSTADEAVSHMSVSGQAAPSVEAVTSLPKCSIDAEPLFQMPSETFAEAAYTGSPIDLNPILDAGLVSYGNETEVKVAGLEAATLSLLPEPEVLFGRDDRQQVTSTGDYPFRCICHLVIQFRGLSRPFVGTGWIIGRRTVITAGHCVFAHPSRDFPSIPRDWAARVVVIPGRSGRSTPFGQFEVPASGLRSTSGWVRQKQPVADYGALILNQDLPIEHLGTLGFGTHSDHELNGLVANIVGYPGERRGTMWGHSLALRSATPTRLQYRIDTTGGQSGSAVFYIRPGNQDAIAVGIHNYGQRGVSNFATRITDEVQNNLLQWRNEGGV